jgi:RimJ/RimL family protein N-acetyltransferase
MTVSAKHRRQGLATRLIHAVVTHAESVRGLDSIELGTSEFQSSARYLFEKLGWEFQKTDEEWVGFVSATIFRFRRAVETKKRR